MTEDFAKLAAFLFTFILAFAFSFYLLSVREEFGEIPVETSLQLYHVTHLANPPPNPNSSRTHDLVDESFNLSNMKDGLLFGHNTHPVIPAWSIPLLSQIHPTPPSPR